MNVLVCGDRNWTNCNVMEKRLSELDTGTVMITGGARGADKMAESFANYHGMECNVFPAEWERYGRGAGPIRNRQMLDEKPDLVIAFHNDIRKSKGTKDCVYEAMKRGIRIEIINEDGEVLKDTIPFGDDLKQRRL